MKNIVTVVLTIAGIVCNAQDRVPTQEEAVRYFETTDVSEFSRHTITEEDELFSLYSRHQPGDVIVSGSAIYKVEQVRKVHLVNFGAIMLEQTLTPSQAVELEKTIAAKYRSGVPFTKLIEEYSEYKYASNSEMEWVLENFDDHRKEMFEKYKVGEIFAINDPGNNSYHLYVKNSEPISGKVIYVWEAKYK